MKVFFKKIVFWVLKILAKKRLKTFDGKIIAVTGSVGKTSTKDAIFTILNSKYHVKKSKKSMNSDFGLLLTILDIESGFNSVTKWSLFLIKAFWNSLFKDHSEIMLLEMGVDSPGDMDFLTSIVKPDIAIMTNIFPVHLAEGQFKDLNDIFEEKKKLVESMNENGVAILNIDNLFLENFAKSRNRKQALTFGRSDGADFQAVKIKSSIEGLSFVLKTKEADYEVKASVLGEYQIYVLLPALACASLFDFTMEEAIVALGRYSLPPGRMSVVPAIEDSTILDSSYNSSPEALKAALKVLKEVGSGGRKVAVLGNMNELGEENDVLHEMIGEVVMEYTDFLITVGDDAKLIAKKALEKGGNRGAVHSYGSAAEAAKFFKKEVKKGDVILVKGSQNKVMLERFVKALMKNPEDAKRLLVRQEKVWNTKP